MALLTTFVAVTPPATLLVGPALMSAEPANVLVAGTRGDGLPAPLWFECGGPPNFHRFIE